MADVDHDDLLDILEPAQAAGLVREDGIERFLFSHALVRDTLRRLDGAVAPGPAARPGRRGAPRTAAAGRREEARHWLAAGPAYAGQAWQAAVAAAEVARQLHAHEEAADLLAGGVRRDGRRPRRPRRRSGTTCCCG